MLLCTKEVCIVVLLLVCSHVFYLLLASADATFVFVHAQYVEDVSHHKMLSSLLCCCCIRRQCQKASMQNYPTVEDAYNEGKRMMSRGGKQLGVLTPRGPEDMRFRAFFGGGGETVRDCWGRMVDRDLVLEELDFVHFLWALAFMCVYPKNENVLCTICGGRDPKTVRAKIWPMIDAMYELNYDVVRTIQNMPFCLI